MSKVLTADEVFGTSEPREWVSFPEWGSNGEEVGFYCKTLTAEEREEYEDKVTDDNGKQIVGPLMAYAMAFGAVNEQGEKVFKVADAPKLAAKSGPAIMRFWAVFRRLNTISDDDVKELAKN